MTKIRKFRAAVAALCFVTILGGAEASAGQVHPSKTKNWVLANQGDFITLNDVSDPEFRIFLSYTGEQFDHCGIEIKTHGIQSIRAFAAEFETESQEAATTGQLEGDRYLTRVPDPKQTRYGEFFMLRTRSKQGISRVLSTLAHGLQVDARVEILACRRKAR